MNYTAPRNWRRRCSCTRAQKQEKSGSPPRARQRIQMEGGGGGVELLSTRCLPSPFIPLTICAQTMSASHKVRKVRPRQCHLSLVGRSWCVSARLLPRISYNSSAPDGRCSAFACIQRLPCQAPPATGEYYLWTVPADSTHRRRSAHLRRASTSTEPEHARRQRNRRSVGVRTHV